MEIVNEIALFKKNNKKQFFKKEDGTNFFQNILIGQKKNINPNYYQGI